MDEILECTICLASMKRGEGQAIYTAECSHSFHFSCIASNVKHGNKTCPVCRAKWKEVPSLATTIIPPVPPRQSSNFRLTAPSIPVRSIIPSVPPQQSSNFPFMRPSYYPVLPIIPQVPPLQSSNFPFMGPSFPVDEPDVFNDEPAVFNDDEALDVQSSSNNTSDTTDGSSLKGLLMETHTEVSAMPQLTAVDDFTVLVHLKAPVSTSNQNFRAPVDLVTVLDISGSMAGTKLELLKWAMGFVIENLGPADRLSVVVFPNTARRLFPLKKMSDTGKQHALQAVNSLAEDGNTNIADGLRMSGKVMEDRREKNPVAGIMLLSDGQDTCGMHSSSVPRIKFPVHTFGFGEDHDARLMHSISERSRGTFSFIENEIVIQDAFAQCIGGLLSVVVKDLQVTIESANPNILLRSLKAGSYKNQLMPDKKSGYIDVGDLYADEERDFLISVKIPKETTFRNETSLLKVNCHYTDPLTKETINLVSENVTIKRPENVGEEYVVSIKVDRQRNRLQSAEAMEQARKAAEEGDLTRAVSILENFRKDLSETVSAKSGDHLCTALDAELKEMQDRMASRHTYEHSGRAYVLSGLSSHKRQRATAMACGGTFGASLGQAYQTPAMAMMVNRSQANPFLPGSILSRLISHNRQRDTTSACGGTFGASLGQAYQTPAMAMMVNRSQAISFLPGESSGPRPRLTGSSLTQYGMM